MLKLTDMEATCKIANARGIPVVGDNTFATPMLQQPILSGVTMVVHSTTKYMGGHMMSWVVRLLPTTPNGLNVWPLFKTPLVVLLVHSIHF